MIFRVKDHMASESIPPELPEDRNFLSRFVVTKACDDSNGGVQTEAWEEWIEPISIHFRHPFSLNNANKDLLTAFSKYPKGYKEISKPIINSEHVLLQSALSFYNNSRINYGLTHTNRSELRVSYVLYLIYDTFWNEQLMSVIYIIDQTIIFYSTRAALCFLALFHFLVARTHRERQTASVYYNSRIIVSADNFNAFNQVSFNEVYTWELTLLEPSKFWEDVSVPH